MMIDIFKFYYNNKKNLILSKLIKSILSINKKKLLKSQSWLKLRLETLAERDVVLF